MIKKRRQFSAKFKFQVALEASKETRTINEIASHYNLHPTQVKQWKRQLQQEGDEIFSQNGTKERQDQQALETELYEQIGRLKMELEWVKKKSTQFS